jgi:very-short-patch-repair endonuclease
LNLEDWFVRNQDRLGSDYEKLFVKNVLPLVNGLNISALSAQYHFLDDRGQNRYCDFVIQEGYELKIAVEIDGYDKRNTGHGMTRLEFLDWQRRHASLVSQGWRVLRFANVEVRDDPARCAEHLNLLLRDERSRESHRRSLEKRIRDLENRQAPEQEHLKVAEDRATYDATASVPKNQEQDNELKRLKLALATAGQAVQLSDQEHQRLNDLDQAQLKIQVLEKETNLMKTTIWALTALMALLLTLFFLDRSDFGEPTAVSAPEAEREVDVRPARPADEQVTSPTLAGSSCTQPLPWNKARTHVGEVVALSGPVTRVAYREDVRGQPTFITLGRAFPSHERVNVVIWGNHRAKFTEVLEQGLEGRDVCIFSEIQERDGLPQIMLRDRTELQLR